MIIVAAAAASVLGAGHALLYKRDPRSSLGWIATCIFVPFAGPLIYYVFGINRIRTHARHLEFRGVSSEIEGGDDRNEIGVVRVSDLPAAQQRLARVSGAVSGRPLVGGARVTPLHNGEAAYPAMLQEIDAAQSRLYLSTYIFDAHATGRGFIRALSAAQRRGVDVRVIIDGIGGLYSYPRAARLLAAEGVPVRRFLPPRLIPPRWQINLRDHRKLLIADGRVGFTGGMNIGDRHLAESASPGRVVDTHFRFEGRIVRQMEKAFLDDWRFVAGQETELSPESIHESVGDSVCRAIVDGPNEDFGKLLMILVSAISTARDRLTIVTPYFLPYRELITALRTAALRGVAVRIILPATNNLPYVHWATRNMLWELLEQGVRIYYQPGPFVHTKLMLVDDYYTQVGSANIDPRSLRLNFELSVEIFDKAFAATMAAEVEGVLARSREVALEEVDGRSIPVRVRDSLAWLASPYL